MWSIEFQQLLSTFLRTISKSSLIQSWTQRNMGDWRELDRPTICIWISTDAIRTLMRIESSFKEVRALIRDGIYLIGVQIATQRHVEGYWKNFIRRGANLIISDQVQEFPPRKFRVFFGPVLERQINSNKGEVFEDKKFKPLSCQCREAPKFDSQLVGNMWRKIPTIR